MAGNVTVLDKILANSSYISNMRVASDAVGFLGMLKISMLRLGILGSVSVSGNGKSVMLTKATFPQFWRNVAIAANYHNDKIKVHGNRISFEYNNRKIVFNADTRNLRVVNETIALINEQFFSNQYDFKRIEGRAVVDIGANVGDSPILFALNGARKVYAYEPFTYAYDQALKNIALNRLGSRILMHNEGVAGKESSVSMDLGYVSNTADDITRLRSAGKRKSKKIRLVTLDSIVEKYKIRHGLLKSDCEGAEYGIFMNSKDSTLRAFDEMIVEYHYGYLDIRKRLYDLGFSTTVTRPTKMIHADSSNFGYAGLIKARKG